MLKHVGTRISESASIELEQLSKKLNISASKIVRYSIYRFLVDAKKESRLNESDKMFFHNANEYLRIIDGLRTVNEIDVWKEALKTMGLDHIPFVKEESGNVVEIEKGFMAELNGKIGIQEKTLFESE